MAFCGKCGNNVNNGAAFCNKCGNNIGAMRTQPGGEHTPSLQKINRKWLIEFIMAFLVLMVAGNFVVAYFNSTTYKVNRYVKEGENHIKAGKHLDAVASFDHAVRLDPAREKTYLSIADKYAKNGRYAEGIAVLMVGQSATGSDKIKAKIKDYQALAGQQVIDFVGEKVDKGVEAGTEFLNEIGVDTDALDKAVEIGTDAVKTVSDWFFGGN